jgi:anti-sigma regulatory factor (Ser/Thr protein kinase)
VSALVDTSASSAEPAHYRHEAFLYDLSDEFYDVTLRFIRDAVAADQPILVALAAPKIDRLRAELGSLSDTVLFADMAVVGDNPARIIPAWSDFLRDGDRTGTGSRGIGEPIAADQSPAQRSECQRHEALLNVAFPDPDFWLLCPYDTSVLDHDTLAEARRTHPMVHEHGASGPSPAYPGATVLAEPFRQSLPDPPASARCQPFGKGDLAEVRARVARQAHDAGIPELRIDDLVVAANEVATNSLRYGGLAGELRMWEETGSLICEFRDRGSIHDPLVGRQRPALLAGGGRGLWLANQLCDLVQIRSLGDGTVVRLHSRLR